MPRKTIELPETFLFTTHYDVLYSDVNAANHLGADRLLSIAMEAQLRFIRQLGHSKAIAFEDAGLIMAHAETAYLAEADYGDRLCVELGARNIENKSFQFVYRISKDDSGEEVARVATTLLFFDYQLHRVVAVPDNFRAQVAPSGKAPP
ncbi:MAG: thioesterase family protein [Haliea sp.]|jgi:acyl-CoA thioesterase FadM|nr:thioesterase family protein [Haliea sp.]MDP4789430.1 thioesterase family protein [Haliea sp.]MDP5063886.1 thioesterase family protein [Haliea sp.]